MLTRRRARPTLPYNLGDQQGSAWDARSEQAARMLREAAGDALKRRVRLADLGCGNQRLRSSLQSEFGSTRIVYRGFDIHPQADDVAFFDVRQAAPPGEWDVVAMLGVLEYVEDLPAALRRLAGAAPWYLVSHVVSDGRPAAESERRRYGWTRLPSAAELSQELAQAGFTVAGHRLLDEGRTGLWVCRSNPAGRPAAGSSAPDDM